MSLVTRSSRSSLTELGLADVDQHVGVGAVAHRQVVVVPAVVVLYGLLLGASRHHIIVELAPLVRGGWRKEEAEVWERWKEG